MATKPTRMEPLRTRARSPVDGFVGLPAKSKNNKTVIVLAVIISHIVNSFAGPMGSGNCAGDRSNLPRSALETT